MRILHVLDSLDPRYGGPARAVVDLCARGPAYGVESEFVGFGNAAASPQAATTHNLRLAGPAQLRYPPGWRAWLQENLGRFDGVVLHASWCAWGSIAASECRKDGVRYAYFPHGMLEPWPVHGQGLLKRAKKLLYWSLLEKNVVRHSESLLFNTGREMRLSAQSLALPPVKSTVIPYGVAIDPKPAPPEPPSGLEDLAGVRYGLFLSRIHPKKNPDLLIRAWAQGTMDAWTLVIAGPSAPEYLESLKRLAAEHRIAHRVRFIGFVEGTAKAWLFQHARWFLLPSSQENFGVAPLEAIWYNCPAVLSDQVALAEEMPNPTPMLPVSVQDWAAFFKEKFDDENFRQELLRAQREYVDDRFDIEKLAEGWSMTLKQIFAASPR